jgi:hypothetical protein
MFTAVRAIEETTPTNRHAPSVDEVVEFVDECSFLWQTLFRVEPSGLVHIWRQFDPG